MGIFGSIVSKIFGHGAQAAPAANQATGAGAAQGAGAAAAPSAGSAATTASWTNPASSGAATGSAAPQATVDVEAVLNEMAAKAGQPLNWRQSIVDLLKLLGLDSSLAARKELANELHYTGDTNDSATMNVWLHKQVMQKLAANGGKVPEDLKH